MQGANVSHEVTGITDVLKKNAHDQNDQTICELIISNPNEAHKTVLMKGMIVAINGNQTSVSRKEKNNDLFRQSKEDLLSPSLSDSTINNVTHVTLLGVHIVVTINRL